MANPVGPLLPADEQFTHQVVETFATVGTTDPSWTEKVCAMAAARDGSLQLGFGLGKYTNRNVMDAYVGRVARRRADDRPREPSPAARTRAHRDRTDPLRGRSSRARRSASRSKPTTCQPIAFDWVFEAVVPPHVEDRTHTATATGCRPSSCATTRRAWPRVGRGRRRAHRDRRPTRGCRPVTTPGACATASACRSPTCRPVRHRRSRTGASFQFLWSPVLMERPDGSRYALCRSKWSRREGTRVRTRRGARRRRTSRWPRGDDRRHRTRAVVRPVEPPAARRTHHRHHGRRLDAPVGVEVVSDTGFHLGAGLYFGFDGHFHGEWRGELVRRRRAHRRLLHARARRAPAPDPRHRHPRHRPGRRW